jgi:uncharacterized repeat protein (TIGR04138 family)
VKRPLKGMSADFYQKIEGVLTKDARYKADAYEFVMQALWFTQKRLDRQSDVSGQELLEGIREFALEQYGPMAKAVFQHWGINKTDDFGEIVFNMVEVGLMGKSEKDSPDDFKNFYDFNQAFNIFNPKNE